MSDVDKKTLNFIINHCVKDAPEDLKDANNPAVISKLQITNVKDYVLGLEIGKIMTEFTHSYHKSHVGRNPTLEEAKDQVKIIMDRVSDLREVIAKL